MMIKKTVFSLVSILLCLSFIAGVFYGCDKKKDENNPSEKEYDGLVVFEEGKETAFKVVRGETASNNEVDTAKSLRVKLKALSGQEITIATDYVGRNDPDPAGNYEILIGKTKRPESETALHTLTEKLEKDGKPEGYGIAVIGNKLAIVGTNARMLQKGCDALCSLFDGKELRIPEGYGSYAAFENLTPDDFFYSSRNYRLDPDKDARIAAIPPVGGFNVCQGCCSDGEYFYVGLIDKKKSPETIRLEKRLLSTGELVLSLNDASTGHANDLTYYPETNEIAIVNETVIEFFSTETLAFTHKVDLLSAASATAYEPTSQRWALLMRASSGRNLTVYDKDFKSVRSWHVDGSNQGIVCTEGAILVLTFNDAQEPLLRNRVEVYSWEGTLLKTYYLGFPGAEQEEAEELFIVGNDVYVGYFDWPEYAGYLYKCKFTLE